MADKELQSRTQNLSAAKQALLLIEELRSRLEENERRAAEPIAIIGAGCRFPGNVNSLAEFWELLRGGKEAIREVPADRWNIDEFYDPDPQRPGKMNTRWGGFLDRVDEFDADFFEISDREATRMDPQQRLTLEVTAEALEDATILAVVAWPDGAGAWDAELAGGRL